MKIQLCCGGGQDIGTFRFPQLLTVSLLLIGVYSVEGKRAKSFLYLNVEADAERMKWNTPLKCKEPLVDLSFAPPRSTGLETGKLTLSSLVLGQMGTFQLANGTTYETLPVKSYNLTTLNNYGICLGLERASNVLEWAKQYRDHLGADESCDGSSSTWRSCGMMVTNVPSPKTPMPRFCTQSSCVRGHPSPRASQE